MFIASLGSVTLQWMATEYPVRVNIHSSQCHVERNYGCGVNLVDGLW